jgi:PAS domain S-box-containing protein
VINSPGQAHASGGGLASISAILESATDAFVQADMHGVVTGWNDQAAQLWGWSRAHIIGRPAHLLVPLRNRAVHDQGLRDLLASTTRTAQREITALHRDGREFRIEVAISALQLDETWGFLTLVRDVNPLKRVERAFHGNENRYRLILDQIQDACAVVDLRGNYLYLNAAFCSLFGTSKDRLLGTNFADHRQDEGLLKLPAIYAQVYRTGEPVKAFAYRTTRGAEGTEAIFVEASVSLERDAQGQAVGFLSIFRDCTDRTLAEQEAVKAREAAEAANRAKGEFLANMSHEIRTPMNGVIGMALLALDTELTPYQADCLDTVRSSAESLLTILNDILDFSKIESGKLELERVPFSLSDIVGDALKPLAARSRHKGLELLSDIAPGVPTALFGDPTRLKQILINLVGNAIKFTECGQIVVSVREDVRRGERTVLHFTVADTGIGIPANQHDTIFEAFRQADGSTTRRFGGTGLGLSISSTLVDLMGGRLWVDSEPGAGSTFHFTAGFDEPPTVAVSDRGQPAPAARPVKAVKVLIAEDNPVNQRVAVGLLTKRGHDVTAVGNGREAIDALDREPFDLVLMDVQMPEMGGFEATAAIRARERQTGQHIRIVAMTAHAMLGDRERCMAAGMDGYLSKPIDPQLLFAAVEDDPTGR